jgi:hypothetical protein
VPDVPLYHIARLERGTPEFAEIAEEFAEPGFEVHSIIEVQNSVLLTRYRARMAALRAMRRGNVNERIAYHTTKGDPHYICQKGLDYRRAKHGFFGKGLYAAEDPMKANDYSSAKGNPTALRMMLRCKVLLGMSKEFEVGRFNRDLFMEPEGFDSVTGFIRRNYEYVLYSSDHIYISHIVFYRFTDTVLEMTPSFALPPNVNGQIFYISDSLNKFFGELQQRGSPDQQVHIKRLIAALLNRTISVQDFIKQTSTILNATAPDDMLVKLSAALAQCNLPPSTVPASGGGAAAASGAAASSVSAAAASGAAASSVSAAAAFGVAPVSGVSAAASGAAAVSGVAPVSGAGAASVAAGASGISVPPPTRIMRFPAAAPPPFNSGYTLPPSYVFPSGSCVLQGVSPIGTSTATGVVPGVAQSAGTGQPFAWPFAGPSSGAAVSSLASHAAQPATISPPTPSASTLVGQSGREGIRAPPISRQIACPAPLIMPRAGAGAASAPVVRDDAEDEKSSDEDEDEPRHKNKRPRTD